MKTYDFGFIANRSLIVICCGLLFTVNFLCDFGQAAPPKKSSPAGKATQPSKPQPKADTTAKNDALTQAVFFKEKEKIPGLLKQGANVNGVDSQMRTPLTVALIEQSNGDDMLDIMHMLRDSGALISPDGMGGMVNDSAIMAAFQRDDAVFIQTLGSVYGSKFYNEYQPGGSTLLMQAAVYAASETAKALLDAGVSANSGSKSLGETPLMLVGQNGPVFKIVSNASTLEGFGQKKPKEFATQLAQAEETEKSFVRLLVVRGANLNAQDAEGNTALFHAAKNGRVHLIQELLKQGANPNFKNHEGQTALITVITKGQRAIQEVMNSTENMLRSNGIIKTPATPSSQTANSNKKAESVDAAVVRILLESGADPSIKDKVGKTALTYALADKRTAIIQLLRGKTLIQPQTQSPIK